MKTNYKIISIAAGILLSLSLSSYARTAGKKAETKDKRIETRFLTAAKEAQQLPPDSAKAVIRSLFSGRDARNSRYIQKAGMLAEEVLGDPESPYCNEELYITALEELLKSGVLTETEKTRPRLLLETASKNRQGSPASDFAFRLRSGEKSTLYAIETPYTLLFFNDPDCDRCKKAKERLAADKKLQRLLEQKRITVLGIYPFWETDVWQACTHYLPETWLDGCDEKQDIMENDIYDLRTSPTLYLLDRKKKVLIKNGTSRDILDYLKTIPDEPGSLLWPE